MQDIAIQSVIELGTAIRRPDGITIATFPEAFRPKWPRIQQQLLDGTRKPTPVRRKFIPKEDGSERHLGIPNIQERLIRNDIMRILNPIFDPGFSELSFGFRPKRSDQSLQPLPWKRAIKQVQQQIQAGYATSSIWITPNFSIKSSMTY